MRLRTRPLYGVTHPPAVLLGGEVIAVSAARSLGGAGIRVYAVGDRQFDPVARSRYCRAFVDLGSGNGVQERWLTWLSDDAPRGAVIIPCNDDGLEMIARNRRSLEELGYVPAEANDEVVLAMLDKARTYDLARATGVGAPQTTTIRRLDQMDEVLDQFEYPCALKPLHSHIFARRYGVRTKAFVARNRVELARYAAVVVPLGIEMMVTEIIPGTDDEYCSYYSYLDNDGQPLFHFTKRKIRQCPPHFGLGSYHMTDWNPEVMQTGLRFLQGANVRGLANVEFKRDARDGTLKLIECNHRLTAATELVRRAGIDLALLSYNRALRRPQASMSEYRLGVRLWCPVEDIRAFVSYRRSRELTLGDWLRSVAHRQSFPLFSLVDPKPSFFSWSRVAVRGFRRLSTRAHPPRTAAFERSAIPAAQAPTNGIPGSVAKTQPSNVRKSGTATRSARDRSAT